MNINELTEIAAARALAAANVAPVDSEAAVASLAWEVGGAFSFEQALAEIARHAIDVDREQRVNELGDTELDVLLAAAWREGCKRGIAGGSYYTFEDVRAVAAWHDLPDVADDHARAALRRFNDYEVQDGETLLDAIKEVDPHVNRSRQIRDHLSA